MRRFRSFGSDKPLRVPGTSQDRYLCTPDAAARLVM